ncbi:MAG: pyridoxine 5'-phosphate synthase [Sulfurospirillaceae bacterium]|nr:pyridoxine 5'-phosphate synthase [Sulfurospirillaceae bacterium]
MFLGVNIDHIAVLREARKINDPDPMDAVSLLKRAGANQITIHLREDRRHMNDKDAQKIIENSPLPVNMECSINPDIIDIVIKLNPHRVTLVPEKREEVTTEGGLDVAKYKNEIALIAKRLEYHHIELSLFIDPTTEGIRDTKEVGAQWVELHTGLYANIYAMLHTNMSKTHHCIKELDIDRTSLHVMLKKSLKELHESAKYANTLGLRVAAGHGLNYQNVKSIVDMSEIEELNIGQSIIARSIFTGFETAVKDMLELVR